MSRETERCLLFRERKQSQAKVMLPGKLTPFLFFFLSLSPSCSCPSRFPFIPKPCCLGCTCQGLGGQLPGRAWRRAQRDTQASPDAEAKVIEGSASRANA
jgi:hypothetical protein